MACGPQPTIFETSNTLVIIGLQQLSSSQFFTSLIGNPVSCNFFKTEYYYFILKHPFRFLFSYQEYIGVVID